MAHYSPVRAGWGFLLPIRRSKRGRTGSDFPCRNSLQPLMMPLRWLRDCEGSELAVHTCGSKLIWVPDAVIPLAERTVTLPLPNRAVRHAQAAAAQAVHDRRRF